MTFYALRMYNLIHVLPSLPTRRSSYLIDFTSLSRLLTGWIFLESMMYMPSGRPCACASGSFARSATTGRSLGVWLLLSLPCWASSSRLEEHTSELQYRRDLV